MELLVTNRKIEDIWAESMIKQISHEIDQNIIERIKYGT